MLYPLLQNASLLVLASLAIVSIIGDGKTGSRVFGDPLMTGLLLGATALLVTSFPVDNLDGVLVDARAGPVMFAGALGGPLAGLIAACLGGLGRAIAGGPLAATGVVSICVYALLGALYGYLRSGLGGLVGVWTIVHLIGLSFIGAGVTVYFVQPQGIDPTWIVANFPFICLANVLSVSAIGVVISWSLAHHRISADNRELQGRLELAMRAAEIGTWELDLRQNEIQWNDASPHNPSRASACYAQSEWREAIVEDDRERVEAALRQALAGAGTLDTEFRIRTRTGEMRYLRLSAAVVMGADNTPERLVGICNDLTSLRTSQAAVREGERRFADMADSIPGAILRYVLHSDGRDEIPYISDGCQGLWELSAAEIVAEPRLLWETVLPEDLAQVRASVLTSAQHQTTWNCTWRARTPSGREKRLQGQGYPIAREDGSVLWNSLVLDITDCVASAPTDGGRPLASVSDKDAVEDIEDSEPWLIR
ncbi:MAG: PAS domain-containing protein [Pseudomonadota bacterium]